MPKNLKEFAELEEVEPKKGGRKVDWNAIANDISHSGLAWTVKEIHERFVKQRVGLFRTKNALDQLVEKGKLESRYDGRRYWYSKVERKAK